MSKDVHKAFRDLDVAGCVNALKEMDEEHAARVIRKNVELPEFYIIHGKREPRDEFYKLLIEELNKVGWNECSEYLLDKITLAHKVEHLFDAIKDTLTQCDVETLSKEKQCWSHVRRAEAELFNIRKKLNEYLQLKGSVTNANCFHIQLSPTPLILGDCIPISNDWIRNRHTVPRLSCF